MHQQKSHTVYIARVNKTLDYIELNLDKPLTLAELADVAHFSKFHFNRIFSSILGETPFQFIQRLRLEKAATLLLTNDESVSEIAYQCGFSDISIFSRNFKKHFKASPSHYRTQFRNSNNSQHVSNSTQAAHKAHLYFCSTSKTVKWRTEMDICTDIEVKELPQMTVAYIRHMGPYDGTNEVYQQQKEKLFAWAGPRGLLSGENFLYLILYHDNPNVSLNNDSLRMSQCITVPQDTEVEGEIGKLDVASTQYVVARFELKAPDFPKAWDWLYGQWFPSSGYQPDDKPYFEIYPEMPRGDLYIVDFCIPVKRA